MMHRPKHIAEYLALRAAAAVILWLPHRAALAIGWTLARLALIFMPGRVREAERRIRTVFGDRYSPREIRRIAWLSGRNLAFNAVEMLRVRRITPASLQRTTNSHAALAAFVAHAQTGRGAIVALPHMGNWETGAFACHFAGIPIFSIAARQKNPLVDNYLNHLRHGPGQHAGKGITTLARGSGTMRDVIRRLRAGGFLAILPDVRVPVDGIRVPFLGGEANVGPGMALFARHANAPIFSGYITREGWTRQVMHPDEPIWPDPSLDKEADILRMTREVLARIDAWIRANPTQWFWYNRRWILDPLPPPPHSPPNPEP